MAVSALDAGWIGADGGDRWLERIREEGLPGLRARGLVPTPRGFLRVVVA